MQAGEEKVLSLTFPEDYHAEDCAVRRWSSP
jgi:FKBP-type peptidyl-prolyl cis-trans isomerase (trigger factor)